MKDLLTKTYTIPIKHIYVILTCRLCGQVDGSHTVDELLNEGIPRCTNCNSKRKIIGENADVIGYDVK